MTISVVIATYNRAALLDECLSHLRTQPFGPDDEVLVVDNGCADDTVGVVQRQQPGWSVPLRLLRESCPGKSHAIRRAVDAAAGDILLFIDDDVNVGAGWLEAIRRVMADGAVTLAGGPVVARWEASTPQWVRHARECHPRLGAPIALLDYGDQAIELGARTLLGANLAIRRDAFLRVGGFATHLGKLRGTLLSGEDHQLCQRVQAAGFRAVYVPDAIVHHWVPADRARVSYFLQWFFWSGITHATGRSPRCRCISSGGCCLRVAASSPRSSPGAG
jgi:GT2 family glycosyltransferase